jgi:hypothetical protein
MAQWRERQHQQQYYQDVTQPLRPVTQITDTESESDTEDGTLSLFGRINEAFYVSMQLPIIFNPVKRDVESINRMIKKGMTPEKIPVIVKECLNRGLTIVSPASIERPFYISEQKNMPKDDGYTE